MLMCRAQNGVLIDMYARSDITQLAKGNAYNRLQWEEVTVGQALALAQIASPPWPNAQSGPVTPVRRLLLMQVGICLQGNRRAVVGPDLAGFLTVCCWLQGDHSASNHAAASKQQRVYVCTAHDTLRWARA